MRDNIVVENHGKNSNYFSLDDVDRTKCRRLAVNRYLSENPAWLVRWESSLVKLPEEERDKVRPFACDLIASHMTAIWASTNAYGKRKLRNEGAVKCEDCQSKLQTIQICPSCDTEHPKKRTVVFLP